MAKPTEKKAEAISSTQFIGLFVWIIALILHLICVGQPMTQVKLIIYLAACGAELYILKYLVADMHTIFFLKSIAQQPYGAPVQMVLENESDNLNRWTNEIDMDLKENKLTYQKSRLFVILALAVVE